MVQSYIKSLKSLVYTEKKQIKKVDAIYKNWLKSYRDKGCKEKNLKKRRILFYYDE